jgi:hypothetical protein
MFEDFEIYWAAAVGSGPSSSDSPTSQATAGSQYRARTTMKLTMHLEGFAPRPSTVLQTLTVCGGLLYMQFADGSAPLTTAATLGVGLAYGHLLAASATRQRF